MKPKLPLVEESARDATLLNLGVTLGLDIENDRVMVTIYHQEYDMASQSLDAIVADYYGDDVDDIEIKKLVTEFEQQADRLKLALSKREQARKKKT